MPYAQRKFTTPKLTCCIAHTNLLKPKAGQGMNTAFLDALNLAWKIHAVERGFMIRSTLATYESERMHVAKRLLDFDARYSRLFSEQQQKQSKGDPADSEFVKVFRDASEFTSGYGVSYPRNNLNVRLDLPSPSQPSLLMVYPSETVLRSGHLFPALDVKRVVDGSIVNLEQAVPFNGKFRIFIFAGRVSQDSANAVALADFVRYSFRQGSYYSAFLRQSIEESSAFRAPKLSHSSMYAFCTILTKSYTDVDFEGMLPPFLTADHDQIYLDDAGESHERQAHRRIGLTPDRPAVAVVRPDGYVGCMVRLVEGPATVDTLNEYFGRLVTKKLNTRDDGGKFN